MNGQRYAFSAFLFAGLVLLLALTPVFAQAQVPSKIPVEGRLSNPDGTPVLAASAQVRVQIRSPGVEDCMLYSETFAVNLASSGGRFSVMLNAGDGTVDSSYVWSFGDVFKNNAPFAAGAPNCSMGSSYTPVPGHGRRVQVSIYDGTAWDPFPAYALNSSAYAIEAGNAETVGGLSSASFLQPDTAAGYNLTQTNLRSIFSPTNFTELNALLAGTSTRYTQMAGGNVTVPGMMNVAGNMSLAPQRTMQLGTFSAPQESALSLMGADAGKMWFNTTTNQLMYWNGSSTNMVGTGDFKSDGSMPMSGQLRGFSASTAANPAYTFNGSTSTGMFSLGVNHLAFATSALERLIIDGSAVRIPQPTRLEIGPASSGFSMLQVYNPNDPGATNTDVQFHNGAMAAVGPSLRLLKSRNLNSANVNDSAGDIRFTIVNSAANRQDVAGIYVTATNTTSGSVSGSMNFMTTGAGTPQSRMLISDNGSVGLGTTTPSFLLHLAADSAAKPGTSTWIIASDTRLKDIRAPFTRSLEALEGIETVYFRYKKGNALGLPSDKEYVGIRAQDVKAVIPEAVRQDEKGFFHVTNDAIHWTVFNAVKELYHRWMNDSEELHSEIAELKAKNAALEARLERLEAKGN